MTPAKVRHLVLTQLAVSPPIAALALGIGETALDGAIKRGAVPVVDLGEAARRRQIPTSWLRQQLRISDTIEK